MKVVRKNLKGGESEEGDGVEGESAVGSDDFDELPPGAFPSGPPPAPPAPISTQEDVDLLLEGVQILEIEVVVGEVVEE